jgi:hypothetical protein
MRFCNFQNFLLVVEDGPGIVSCDAALDWRKRTLIVTKIEGWKASLEHLTEEISELWLDRVIWRSIREMVEELPGVRDSFIVAWIGQQYYRRAALSVRTMVDRDPKSDSLLNLLIDISSNPTDVPCPGALHTMRAPGLSTVDQPSARAG